MKQTTLGQVFAFVSPWPQHVKSINTIHVFLKSKLSTCCDQFKSEKASRPKGQITSQLSERDFSDFKNI